MEEKRIKTKFDKGIKVMVEYKLKDGSPEAEIKFNSEASYEDWMVRLGNELSKGSTFFITTRPTEADLMEYEPSIFGEGFRRQNALMREGLASYRTRLETDIRNGKYTLDTIYNVYRKDVYGNDLFNNYLIDDDVKFVQGVVDAINKEAEEKGASYKLKFDNRKNSGMSATNTCYLSVVKKG